jgi:glutathione S-transferase
MVALRIFSYLPNPRIAKATIAARLCGVEIELRGAPAGELASWLWDFDAHLLSEDERNSLSHLARQAKTGFSSRLYKTDAFLEAHPFGTVPAAFDPTGRVGIFESNSIMRAVARLGAERTPLYGTDAYTTSRIDSFLDASLLFARDTQLYILKLRDGAMDAVTHGSARSAMRTYLGGVDRALAGGRRFLVGESLSLADICFVTELALFHNERNFHPLLRGLNLASILAESAEEFPVAHEHFKALCEHPAVAPDLGPYLQALPLR